MEVTLFKSATVFHSNGHYATVERVVLNSGIKYFVRYYASPATYINKLSDALYLDADYSAAFSFAYIIVDSFGG